MAAWQWPSLNQILKSKLFGFETNKFERSDFNNKVDKKLSA
jgi:hypothetical protein